MFKKVLWATDGSDFADAALPLAKALTAEADGELLVVHCEEFTLPGKGPGGRYPRYANEDQLRKKIERQVATLKSDGVPTDMELTRANIGGAAQTIADAAREQPSELIVVGTRGHTPLAGLLLGSVTQRLLHIAPCPVLVVPTKRGDRDG